MAQGRSLYRQIFNNFINSLKPKSYWGVLRGKDHFGTEYYESTKSLQNHKGPSRWFVPVDKEAFDQEIPTEWQAWLRNRRKDPPTEEEIQMNQMKMQQTIENAAKLEPPKTVNQEEIKTFEKPAFPVYEEYNTTPYPGKTKR